MGWPPSRDWAVEDQQEGSRPLGATLESGLEPPTPVRPQPRHLLAGDRAGLALSLGRRRKQGPDLIPHVLLHVYLSCTCTCRRKLYK